MMRKRKKMRKNRQKDRKIKKELKRYTEQPKYRKNRSDNNLAFVDGVLVADFVAHNSVCNIAKLFINCDDNELLCPFYNHCPVLSKSIMLTECSFFWMHRILINIIIFDFSVKEAMADFTEERIEEFPDRVFFSEDGTNVFLIGVIEFTDRIENIMNKILSNGVLYLFAKVLMPYSYFMKNRRLNL